MRLRRRAGLACFLVVFLASACTSPPNKEMDQAQGAIDAARAAGAERYAAKELAAANAALKSANDAVQEGDYRLALNHALEPRTPPASPPTLERSCAEMSNDQWPKSRRSSCRCAPGSTARQALERHARDGPRNGS